MAGVLFLLSWLVIIAAVVFLFEVGIERSVRRRLAAAPGRHSDEP